MPTEMKPSLTAVMSVEECLLKKEWLLRRLCVKGSEKSKSMQLYYSSRTASVLQSLKLSKKVVYREERAWNYNQSIVLQLTSQKQSWKCEIKQKV